MRQNIESIIKFIYLNSDFFAAPLVATNAAFQDWAKTNEDMVRFSNELSAAFDESLNRNGLQAGTSVFYTEKLKLHGSYRESILQLVKDEGMSKLELFLLIKPDVLRVFEENVGNPCIDAWYATQATDKQKIGREVRQALPWESVTAHLLEKSKLIERNTRERDKAIENRKYDFINQINKAKRNNRNEDNRRAQALRDYMAYLPKNVELANPVAPSADETKQLTIDQAKRYSKASQAYAKYLHEVIDDEVGHLSEHTVECLADELGIDHKKKSISEALCKQISDPNSNKEKKEKLLHLIRGKSSLQYALKKYDVIKQAQAKIDGKDSNADIDNFKTHLRNNRGLLTTRRDSGFMTFLKGLGVASASIFGLGVGGFLAYQHLFGSKATEGHRYLEKTEKITATPKPKRRF